MRTKRSIVLVAAVLTVSALTLVGTLNANASGLRSIGVYVYENIETYHAAGATSGNVLVSALLPVADKAIAFDRIPLQSNENVRILSEMTEGREIVVSSFLSSWLAGGVIAQPTIKMADDAIKFKDLTWHVDHDAIFADARERGLNQVLIGSATGQVRETSEAAAKSGSRLVSVTVQANYQLVDLASGSAVWAKTVRHVQAGFDPRVAFDEGLLVVGEKAAADLIAKLGTPSTESQ